MVEAGGTLGGAIIGIPALAIFLCASVARC